MRKKRDPYTLDIFSMPAPRVAAPAAMNLREEVAHLVGEVSRHADGDRYTQAATMSRLQGREVSKHMLDAWSSEARDGHNIPFYMVPLLEVACDSTVLTEWLATVRGGQALFGAETLRAELGRVDSIARKAKQRRAELIAQLESMEQGK